MTNKYRSSYAEGGFLDDGASVDPVSGNEVPVGSLAEEVRDDVPAQLSEGEFVVPADVVRFIGLDKLMKMRNAAKAGLADMEAEGQVGGQPAPIMEEPMMDDDMEMDALIDGMDGGDFDSAVQRFAEGGSVMPSYARYQNREEAASASASADPEMPSYETYTGGRKFSENTTVEYTDYTNAAGDIIKIRTVKGKPIQEVPEGYYKVGDKPPEDIDPIDGGGSSSAQTRSTVNSGMGDAQKLDRDYKNSSSYKNQLNKSQRLTGARQTVLLNLHKSNMTQAEIDNLYDHLTPMAKAEYESRYRDLKGLDKFFAADKSSAELMIAAQSQVNARNYKNGVLETGSYTAPSGNIVTAEGIKEGFKKAFKLTKEGKEALSLGTFAEALAAALELQFRKREGNGKVGDGNNDPTIRPAPPAAKLGQAHWKSRLEELTEQSMNGVITRKEISQILRHERTSVVNSLGRTVDEYGNTLTNPSVRTIWDHIAFMEMDDVAIAQAKISKAEKTDEEIVEDEVEIVNTVIKVEDLYVRSDVDPSVVDDSSVVDPTVVTPTINVSSDVDPVDPVVVEEDTVVSDSDDFISPNVDPGLLAATVNQMNIDAGVAPPEVTGTSDDDTTGFVNPPTISPSTYDDEMRDLSLDGTAYQPEGSGVTITDIDAKTARDDLDKANAISSSNAFFDEMALTSKENAALSTGATLGDTGVLGDVAADIVTPTVTAPISAEEQGVRDLATLLGSDPDEAASVWQEENGITSDPLASQRELEEIEKRKIRDAKGIARKKKIEQDAIDRANKRKQDKIDRQTQRDNDAKDRARAAVARNEAKLLADLKAKNAAACGSIPSGTWYRAAPCDRL